MEPVSLRQLARHILTRGIALACILSIASHPALASEGIPSPSPAGIGELVDRAKRHTLEGRYNSAAEIWEKLIVLAEKSIGPERPAVATALTHLGLNYKYLGLYKKAETALKRALAISETWGGPEIAIALFNLAKLYIQIGELSAAEPLMDRAYSLDISTYGENHEQVAASLLGLADLKSAIGSYKQAEELYIRAIRSNQRSGAPTRQRATIFNQLAILYDKTGEYGKAEKYHKESLAIRRIELGERNRETAASLNNLAYLYSSYGKQQMAEPLYLEALSILENILDPNNPDIASLLNNIGLLRLRQGRAKDAIPLFERSLQISEKSLGESHPETLSTIANLSIAYNIENDNEKAISGLGRVIAFDITTIQREAPYLAQRNRTNYLNSLNGSHMIALGSAGENSRYAELALLARLNRHGLLAEVERAQSKQQSLLGANHQVVAELSEVINIQSSANLNPARRKNLQVRQDELEKRLYREIPSLKPRVVEISEVAKQLPSEGALIEIAKYYRFNPIASDNKTWDNPGFLALILKPNTPVASIDLGPSRTIEKAINKALNASAQNTSDTKELWAQVSQLVIKPLAATLNGSTQWFISPDAELNRVPFAALPSPQDPSQPLGQAIRLRLLTTGRDLLRLRESPKAANAPVVIANPNFDRIVRSTAVIATASNDDLPESRSADLAAKRWPPLPSSEREGQLIGALLATQPITGSDATAKRLQQLKSPRVLHIASHGFFVADVEKEPNDPLQALQDQSAMLRSFRGEDPLLRSGLVLAGANWPEADPNDDGYLTAAEAVGLQLDGTELVALSACSTGQSDIRTGEGVYGLQRSLTVAGARSTLLSLWKVDDAATAVFMTRFYQRLKDGEGRSDALAAVQEEFRSGKAQSGTGVDWKEPYYWAAWQLVGDWRPIPGL